MKKLLIIALLGATAGSAWGVTIAEHPAEQGGLQTIENLTDSTLILRITKHGHEYPTLYDLTPAGSGEHASIIFDGAPDIIRIHKQ